jgi:hypothetical protein
MFFSHIQYGSVQGYFSRKVEEILYFDMRHSQVVSEMQTFFRPRERVG